MRRRAGLLIRGVQQAQTQAPGFRVDGVLVVSLAFPGQAYDQARGGAFVAGLHSALKGDDSLDSVALTNTVPLGNARNMTSFRLPGEDEKQSRMIQIEGVSPEYFTVRDLCQTSICKPPGVAASSTACEPPTGRRRPPERQPHRRGP